MNLHIIPVDDTATSDKFIIYRPLLGIAFVGNRAMAELAQDHYKTNREPLVIEEGDIIQAFLNRIGFLLPDPPEPPPASTTFRPTMTVLLMTNQCQLRCTYCYASAGEVPAQTLSREQGYAAIDYVCQNAIELQRPQFEVSFHGGGEPTLAWSVLSPRRCLF